MDPYTQTSSWDVNAFPSIVGNDIDMYFSPSYASADYQAEGWGMTDENTTVADMFITGDSSPTVFTDELKAEDDARMAIYAAQDSDGISPLPTPPLSSSRIYEKKGYGFPTIPASSYKDADAKSRKGRRGSDEGKSSKKSAPSPPPSNLLRTSRRKKSLPKTPISPNDVEGKARFCHNQVEKQYRERLNKHFERLVAVLPRPENDDGEGGNEVGGSGGSDDGRNRRMSKAEALELARRTIRVLEKERASLERQKEELEGNVERLRDTMMMRNAGTVYATRGQ
jgi:hypothetical protein